MFALHNPPSHSIQATKYSPDEKQLLRRGIQFYLLNTFRIPSYIQHNYFKYYKLLYWSGQHLLESIEVGMIVRDDIAFSVIFTQGLTRESIKAAIHRNPNVQYQLSFREPEDTWNLYPVVLVRDAVK